MELCFAVRCADFVLLVWTRFLEEIDPLRYGLDLGLLDLGVGVGAVVGSVGLLGSVLDPHDVQSDARRVLGVVLRSSVHN